MKNKILSSVSKPALTLMIICVIVTFLLAVVNMVTKEPIQKAKDEATKAAMQVVLPADSYQVVDNSSVDVVCYRATGGERDGYVFTSSAQGYGGAVEVMTGIYDDGTISAVEIISVDDETPGLGQNAANDSFKGQFKGKKGNVEVVKTGTGKDNEIDAITSATITSKAVASAVNKAVDAFDQVKGGGTNE